MARGSASRAVRITRSGLSYRYDNNGAFAGSLLLTANVELTDANNFIYSATIELTNTNGDTIETRCGKGTASRF